MKVGLIGCGNIGKEIALHINSSKKLELEYVYDIDKENVEWVSNSVKKKPQFVSFNELVENSELIIEAASKEVVKRIFLQNLMNKKVMIMSSGGLLDLDLPKSAEIFVPTGAISGIDTLKTISGLIDTLEITTTKPPLSLGLDITEKKVIFEGSVDKAIEKYPKNINVAATIYLATNFKPKVKIVADPNVKNNSHLITATGSFGKIELKTENVPSKNPKTSYLAVLSAIQCLKNFENNVKIGC